MTRLLGTLMVTAVALAAASAQSPRAGEKKSPAEELRQIALDLKEARGLLAGVADKTTRDKLELLITRSELAIGDLQKRIVAKPTAMPGAEFDVILKGLKSASFDDDKVKFVKGLGTKVRFTSEQVKSLLAAFSFDAGRTTAAIALHPQVTDPEFYFKALEAFSFESSRREVREKLNLK